MKDLVILGAGGHAREVLWTIETCNAESRAWNVLGFIDEDRSHHGKILCELPVLGDFSWFEKRRPRPTAVCGVGSNPVRRRFAALGKDLGLEFATVVHPGVVRSRFSRIGPGTVVFAAATISTQAEIGAHVNVNTHAAIAHDVRIGDFANISPGVLLSGGCIVEEGADLGAGAVVLPLKRIGRDSVVGAGAVVTKDVPEKTVVVGIPAKVKNGLP